MHKADKFDQKTKRFDFLVAHPVKHHAFNLAAGCLKSGRSTLLVTPLYRKGIGAVIARLPGGIGKKMQGYVHCSLPAANVMSPTAWQIRRLFSFLRPAPTFNSDFDSFTADLILRGALRAKHVVTLQDYMPETIRASLQTGSKIWSDQILNQSDEAMQRIARHYADLSGKFFDIHNEATNREILSLSSVVTYPSKYCAAGSTNFIRPSAIVSYVPYGVDDRMFGTTLKSTKQFVRIVARANTVRKGGHILLRALAECSEKLLLATRGRPLEVVFLGKMEPTVKLVQNQLHFPLGVSIVDVNVPHVDVPSLLSTADLFVMPSLSEGMSLVALEAMQTGLPLILSKFCGVDIFKHGEMGYEVSDAVDSVADALIDAFDHIDNWPEWGANGRRAAAEQTWREYEAQIAELALKLD